MTIEKKSTAAPELVEGLPKAEHANCVSHNMFNAEGTVFSPKADMRVPVEICDAIAALWYVMLKA